MSRHRPSKRVAPKHLSRAPQSAGGISPEQQAGAGRSAFTQLVRELQLAARQESDPIASAARRREVVGAALETLQQQLPQLHEQPEQLAQLRVLLARAESRGLALGHSGHSGQSGQSGPGAPGQLGGTLAIPFARAAGSGAPTASTPIDSGARAASGYGGQWGLNKTNEPVGVPNARLLRDYADRNEWVRAAIRRRKQQIGHADIAVVVRDENRSYDETADERMTDILDQPNEYRDSFRSLFEPVIEDVLTLDRGVFTKAFSLNPYWPTGLYYEDGATIKIFPAWDGNPKSPRYLFEDPNGTRKVPLLNEQAIMIMADAASYRFGLSIVQVLRDTIEAELKARTAAARMVEGKPPPWLIQMPGASDTVIRQLAHDYQATISGQTELFFLGGENAFQAQGLTYSARDNQWMEWQEWLARKIAICFQMSPQELGITFDINKATGETQSDISEDQGLIPLLLLFEEYLNREFVADFAPKKKDGRSDLDKLNLAVVFPEVSEAARALHLDRAINKAVTGLAGLPFMTLNQTLKLLGEEPVPHGGNTFWIDTTNGPMPWLSYDNDYGDFGGWGQVDPALGGQDAAGGPSDPDAADASEDPTDDSQGNNSGSGSNAGTQSNSGSGSGNPTSGSGNSGGASGAGNGNGASDTSAPSAGSSAGSASSSGGASAGITTLPARKAQRRARVKSDTRPPGKPWKPEHAMKPVSPVNPALIPPSPSAIPPTPLRRVSGAHARGWEQYYDGPPPMVYDPSAVADPTTKAQTPNAPTATTAPPARGRVDPHTALGHTRSHGEQQARLQLHSAAQRVFEQATLRGRHRIDGRQPS